MADWYLTGKRDTRKNNTTTNPIGSDYIVTQITFRQDVTEEAVGQDLRI